jgi:hypothetical protein
VKAIEFAAARRALAALRTSIAFGFSPGSKGATAL